MKKFFLLAVMMISSIVIANAQSFSKGDKFIDLSIGLPDFGVYNSISLPVLGAKFDYVAVDNLFDNKSFLSVGAGTSFYASKGTYYKTSAFALAGHAAVHYNFVPKLDTYAGLSLGYNFVKVSYLNDSPLNTIAGSGVAYGLFLGTRYFFTPNVAGLLELGYGYTTLKLGVSLRI
ncbi:hypothetical protein [Porphyromonas sp.]|uniref:hypothetical protein n=1 Tax=Porphyromonas sp. TaxID=1924944 RepID=UPI0026DCBE5F|nr:hypothetical protein [Porphyromonas sp.]MDO4771326.1 hypothetical protein [Porphyromonas sp.]